MLSKWEGIVIRTIPYGETNKIVTLFTAEAGKVTAMARGAKKPKSKLASVTQPFTHGQYLIQKGRGMGTISQGESLSSMRAIHENLEATAYASYIVEMIDKLSEDNQASPAVYRMLLDALNAIREQYDPEAISLFVEWKMLPLGGVHPILHECANCSAREGEFGFSFQYVGFLCHRCFHHDRYLIQLSPTMIKLIRMFFTVPINQVGELTLKPETKQLLKRIVRTLYDEQIGIYFKSRKFLETLEKTPELQDLTKKTESEQ